MEAERDLKGTGRGAVIELLKILFIGSFYLDVDGKTIMLIAP